MGKASIHIDMIPDSMFCEAIQVYDIASAEILSVSKRRYGDGDVIVHRIDGKDIRISRLDLIRDYRYIDGRKIKLSYWRNDTKVNVIKSENKSVAVLYINSDKVIDYGDKLDSDKLDGEEYYIVCDIVDGNIDRGRYTVVLRDKFIRAYRIRGVLNIDIIRNDLGLGRVLGKKREVIEKVGDKRNKQGDGNRQGDSHIEYTLMSEGSRNKELDSYIGYNLRDGDGGKELDSYIGYDFRDEDDKLNDEQYNEGYREGEVVYRATGRVVKDNNTIGFILTGDYGEMRVNKKDLVKLVLEGRVRNIEYTDRDGKHTLIGKGIRISDLPIADIK